MNRSTVILIFFLLIIPKNGSHYTYNFSTRYVNRCPKKEKKNKSVFRHYFEWLNIYGSIYKIILNFLFECTRTSHIFVWRRNYSYFFSRVCFWFSFGQANLLLFASLILFEDIEKKYDLRTKYMWETKNHTHITNFSLRTEY